MPVHNVKVKVNSFTIITIAGFISNLRSNASDSLLISLILINRTHMDASALQRRDGKMGCNLMPFAAECLTMEFTDDHSWRKLGTTECAANMLGMDMIIILIRPLHILSALQLKANHHLPCFWTVDPHFSNLNGEILHFLVFFLSSLTTVH